MDLTLVKLSIERLHEEVINLKTRVSQQEQEIKMLKREKLQQPENIQKDAKPTLEPLLTNLEARQLLNISKNSFIRLVESGAIKPIRMNLRTIRYSKESIVTYLDSLNGPKTPREPFQPV